MWTGFVRGWEKLTLGDTVNIGWMLLNAAILIVPIAIGVALLYWIIRLGVKHGLRSYYAESTRETAIEAPQPQGLG